MKTTKDASAVRFVKTRDSATGILRKMGIESKYYNDFIEKLSNGTLGVHVAKAQMYLNAKAAPKAKAKAAKKPAAPKATKETVSSVARELIRAGKTNAEVFAVLQSKFNLDDSKKGYPAWYRSDLARKGEVIKASKPE
jgi:hypothetical protein